MTSKTFSYDDLTDDMREAYEKALARDARTFLAWARSKPGRVPMERFRSWWMTQGPTAFRTARDAKRYRTDLEAEARLLLLQEHEASHG